MIGIPSAGAVYASTDSRKRRGKPATVWEGQFTKREEMSMLKRIIRTLNLAKIICAALGIYLIYSSVGDVITFLKPVKDFEDVLTGQVSVGDHIDGNVLYLLDYFSTEQSWTENSNGSVTPKETSAYYYIVPGNGIYLGLKVLARDQSEARTLADETYAYLSGADAQPDAQLPYVGKVVPMASEYPEMVEAFQQELGAYGYLAQEIYDMGEPMLIVTRAYTSILVMFGIGVVVLLAAGLWIGKDIRKANQRAAAKAAARAAEEATASVRPQQSEDPWER